MDKQLALIAALQDSRAYPHPVVSIELIETHISWVILTGPFAYKIKKAVHLDFLDFSSLERRRHFCQEELRRNRQWAPQLYLEVVPICRGDGGITVDGTGDAIEYAVKMVQFRQSAQLDKQLAAGLLHNKDVYQLAETVADYHDGARRIEYANDQEAVAKVRAPMLDNFTPLQQVIDMAVLARVQEWTTTSLRELKSTLIARRKKGFVRECHGDLHLANLVRLEEGIVAFDCIEFSAELRNIDVISDFAFLAMDLIGSARQDLAYVFANRYLERTGDYAGMAVFGLYFVYHSMIRAKVAAIRATERVNDAEREQDIDALKHNLAVAARWIDTPGPMLIVMHGYSGSGKSWLSSQLTSQLPAIRVRSDIERKRLFGLGEKSGSGSPPGQGIYTDEANASVYECLLSNAEDLLKAGFNVIVDGSFLRRDARRLFATLADRQSAHCRILAVSAEKDELMRRLNSRTVAGGDASEAGVEILHHQLRHSDSLTPAERKRTISVATDQPVDLQQVLRQIRRGAC